MKTETAYSTVPPSYEGTTGQYAPPMQAAPAAPAMSAAQVGEQYRAERTSFSLWLSPSSLQIWPPSQQYLPAAQKESTNPSENMGSAESSPLS